MEVTPENDLQKVKELLQKLAKEKLYVHSHIEVQALSSEGANYSSNLYVATISAPSKEDLKLFIKVANIDEAMRTSNKTIENSYKMELYIYSKLAYTFESLYNKYGVKETDRLRMGKYYIHDTTGPREILVLENLVAKGFENFDRMRTFDWDYASTAITELAKFHALGVACLNEKLDDLHNIDYVEILADKNDIYKMFQEQSERTAKLVVKDEYRDRMEKYLKNNDFSREMNFLWKKPEKGFFIHGDFRPSNLMHRIRNEKLEIVTLDYQTCHIGSFIADLMFFIWLGSDSQFREKHYQRTIEHYYSELTVALKKLYVDINEVYPRNKFEEELEQGKDVGLFVGLIYLNLLTVDPEDAPKMDSMANMFELKPSKLAKERINEVIGDYIKMGII